MVYILKLKIVLLALCLVNLVGVAALLLVRNFPFTLESKPDQTLELPGKHGDVEEAEFVLPPRPAHAQTGESLDGDDNAREISQLRSLTFDIAEETVRKLKNDPAALSLLGKLHLRNSNPDTARSLWDRALKIDANAPAPYLDYGNLELNLGNLPEAASYFRQALKLNPELLEAYEPLAEVLVTQSKFDDATNHLREWIKREPRMLKAHIQLGKCMHELGRHDEAVASYRAALDINPSSRESAMGLMATYRAKGDRVNAAEAAELFAKLDASDPRVLAERNVVDRDRVKMRDLLSFTVRTAANLLAQSNDIPAAIRQLELAMPYLYDAPEARSQLANLYASNGRFDKSIKLLREPCEKDPDDADAWMSLALFCMKLRQLDAADDALRQVIRLQPNDDYAYRLQAQTQIAQARNLPGAVASAQRAVEISPVAGNLYLLGTAYYHVRDYSSAKESLQKAIALEPDNTEFRRALAEIP